VHYIAGTLGREEESPTTVPGREMEAEMLFNNAIFLVYTPVGQT
jgi:hypothetical protein